MDTYEDQCLRWCSNLDRAGVERVVLLIVGSDLASSTVSLLHDEALLGIARDEQAFWWSNLVLVELSSSVTETAMVFIVRCSVHLQCRCMT